MKERPSDEAENIDDDDENSGAAGRIAPGKGPEGEEEEKSGKTKWRLRPEGFHTAAASRLLMIRSAKMHILCHCSMSGVTLCRTILQAR